MTMYSIGNEGGSTVRIWCVPEYMCLCMRIVEGVHTCTIRMM